MGRASVNKQEIEISFSQEQDFLTVYVSGNCSWDVVRLHDEILAMLPDEEGKILSESLLGQVSSAN
ncbi:hypothetical protein BBR01nite_51750 [Brevibacillus brevis]|nr:hypothetical protein BBR01nite_51750 [Brevibacillus brevis]